MITPQPGVCMQLIRDAGVYKKFAYEYMENPKEFEAMQAMTQFCHERELNLSSRTAMLSRARNSEPSFLQLQKTIPDTPLSTVWLSSTHTIHCNKDNVGVLSVNEISRRRNKFVAVQADEDEVLLPTVILTERLDSVLQLGSKQSLFYNVSASETGDTKPAMSLFLLFKTQFL